MGLISEDTPARAAGAGHAIGNYIVDFVSIKHRLIIELDGSQRLEQTEYDEERTRYLESQRYRVVCF